MGYLARLQTPVFVGDDGDDARDLDQRRGELDRSLWRPPQRSVRPRAGDLAGRRGVGGGWQSNGTPLDDAYLFDGTGWNPAFGGVRPPSRGGATLAESPGRNRLVYVGCPGG